MSATFTIIVPCSTSNLGAGFDALGIAIGGLQLMIRCTPGPAPLAIVGLSGEGATSLPRGDDNRILVAARAHAARMAIAFESIGGELSIDNSIPLARGLGSSAAAAVAGAIVVEALASLAASARAGIVAVPIFDDARVLATALEMEGHPDNVIACLRGGAQVAILDSAGAVRACAIEPPAKLKAAIFIPAQELRTSEARAVLSQTVSLKDAVYNLSRAALFVAALASGKFELLGEAMTDRLHQPARSTLMPWLPGMIAAAREAGALGAALSGAGTTVFALATQETVEKVVRAFEIKARELNLRGRSESLDACARGARIVV